MELVVNTAQVIFNSKIAATFGTLSRAGLNSQMGIIRKDNKYI